VRNPFAIRSVFKKKILSVGRSASHEEGKYLIRQSARTRKAKQSRGGLKDGVRGEKLSTKRRETRKKRMSGKNGSRWLRWIPRSAQMREKEEGILDGAGGEGRRAPVGDFRPAGRRVLGEGGVRDWRIRAALVRRATRRRNYPFGGGNHEGEKGEFGIFLRWK